MSTAKQIEANRANAQFSTGPTSPEGKATSSHNAVKTGLTGQTVLLKTDDVNRYSTHVQHYVDKFQPADYDERLLVQDLADTDWRLLRITPLEAGIYANGRIRLAPLFENETDLNLRAERLDAEVFSTCIRELTNIALQQGRLQRHRAAVTAELKALQGARKRKEEANLNVAASYYCDCLLDPASTFKPEDLGFVFSLDDMFTRIATNLATQQRDPHPAVSIRIRAAGLKADYAAYVAKK